MKRITISLSLLALACTINAQTLTPEMLIQMGKVNAFGLTKDGKSVVYSVRTYNIADNSKTTKVFVQPVAGGAAVENTAGADLVATNRISADGKFSISAMDVPVKKIFGKEVYADLPKSDVMIYDDLNYRHWDTWEDGAFSHVFISPVSGGKKSDSIDIMMTEPYDCPQKPSGGDEDFIWSPDGKQVIYVTKKKYGKEYAISTNTDIYAYDLATKKTTNMSEGMMGYDVNPAFSAFGKLAWLSMRRDGYESDKNDIVVNEPTGKLNLTKDWDGTVNEFRWSNDGKMIYFLAPVDGTVQLFSVNDPGITKKPLVIKQITKGDFDIQSMIGQSGTKMVVTRTDWNHAAEIYVADLTTGMLTQLSHANDEKYSKIKMSKVEKRMVKTSDGQEMLEWVIYPPDFDPAKKYPTILYCQGGPQSGLTQFYSFRWNFQLMAANGYIIVAPNRRGMPGHGVKWNEQISKDYGGQNMQDYLAAIDDFTKEPFCDKSRLGCIGASYGGFSAYYLAGNHNKRFKTFIAHDGIFDWRAMYGTTEEMWFVNWDLGGNYWDKENLAAQKAYNEFNPVNFVKKWDSPILIIQGGQDYRVPIEQGLGAFQAAQLQGIKSKMLYFPNENHWVLKDQNGLVWQREFYKWLKETL
ncbi:MAG TPA: S9 family peptidase [Bacteroidia bacterium]|jgi:dipeptidyl aminopeptidase/acylaminoacyl peptidase